MSSFRCCPSLSAGSLSGLQNTNKRQRFLGFGRKSESIKRICSSNPSSSDEKPGDIGALIKWCGQQVLVSFFEPQPPNKFTVFICSRKVDLVIMNLNSIIIMHASCIAAADAPTTVNEPGPVELVQWGGYQPNTRRALVGFSSATAIALGGNLFGISSFLLGLDGGKTAGNLRLDALIPVKGFKRCVDLQNGYEFIYPAKWLADQRIYRRYAERMERERSLDLPPIRNQQRPRKAKYDPSAAFGPPGSTGEDNMSVIVAPISEGFTVQGLGTPEKAAQTVLDSTIAPPGGDKVARLLNATSRVTPRGDLVYTFEFSIEKVGKWKRHNVAVVGSQDGVLYTFLAQCAERKWKDLSESYFKSANSFQILPNANPNFDSLHD